MKASSFPSPISQHGSGTSDTGNRITLQTATSAITSALNSSVVRTNPFREHLARRGVELPATLEQRRQYSASLIESAWNVIQEMEEALRSSSIGEGDNGDEDNFELPFDSNGLTRQ